MNLLTYQLNSNPHHKRVCRNLLLFVYPFLAIALIAGCSGTDGQATDSDPRISLLDDAELAVFMDFTSMRESEFGKKMEDMDPRENNQLPEQMNELQKELLPKLGLTEDDIDSLAISVSNMEALGNKKIKKGNFSGAIFTKKRVTTAEMEAALNTVSEQKKNTAFSKYKKSDYKGYPLYLDQSAQSEIPMAISLIESGDGSLYLLGDPESVKTSIDRNKDAKITSSGVYAQALKHGLTEKQNWLMMTIPGPLQDKLSASLQAPQVAQMLGSTADALGTLHQIGMTLDSSKQLDLGLTFSLASQKDADAVKTMLDSMMNGMVGMMIRSNFGGSMDFLDAYQSTVEESSVQMQTAITVSDIERMQKKSQQSQQEQVKMPGMNNQ